MVTLSLCCRHLVIDPCNRTPSHLPQSDRWLDSQNDKLTQIVCDWLSDMAWDRWRVDAGASPFDSTAFDVRDLLELRPERGKRDGQGFRVSWFSVERTDSGKRECLTKTTTRSMPTSSNARRIRGSGMPSIYYG